MFLLSASQTPGQAGPARPHLRHLQQGVQEQLQPAAAPVGPHRRPDEGPGGPGEGGGGQSDPGGEADGAAVAAAAHAARPAPRRHRSRGPPPARAAREPARAAASVCVHHPGNRNHGCNASTHPSSGGGRGLHGAGAGEEGGGGGGGVKKNHACEACGKAFRDVYHLNRHRLSHSDEKPYSCPICQQRFKRKDRMSYHVRSHQGGVEKPYICPHCSKAFSRPDHLNSHVRQVHSTERPFKCTTCTSAFATRDRLRAHLIRHEEKVPCHICGKLLSAAYITDHMRVHNQSQHHSCHLCNLLRQTLVVLRGLHGPGPDLGARPFSFVARSARFVKDDAAFLFTVSLPA
uniref:MYC-associated zinc finger protein a (purine-binding transcription factor) n=1 Tax=Takifugu rubripes TaxID=31033 RepID=H2SBB9_TAKRU